MDKNSEALNRAINKSLEMVDRKRRLRGLTALSFGVLLCVFSYIPAFLKAAHGTSVPRSASVIGYLCLAFGIYGLSLIAFGRKVRIYYIKLFGPGRWARVLFYTLFLSLIILLDWLARAMLAILARP